MVGAKARTLEGGAFGPLIGALVELKQNKPLGGEVALAACVISRPQNDQLLNLCGVIGDQAVEAP